MHIAENCNIHCINVFRGNDCAVCTETIRFREKLKSSDANLSSHPRADGSEDGGAEGAAHWPPAQEDEGGFLGLISVAWLLQSDQDFN